MLVSVVGLSSTSIILSLQNLECVFQGIGEMLRSLSSGLMAPGGGAGNNQPSANVTILFISVVYFVLLHRN